MIRGYRVHVNAGSYVPALSPAPLFLLQDSRYNSAVQRDTATKKPVAWPSASGAATGSLIRLVDRRLILLLALALLAGLLAYQAPATADVDVGWLGDRLFLRSSEGSGASADGSLYGDELSPGARSGRSRWTRQSATIWLRGLGAGGDLTLTLRAMGWPA